jgi:hypothetical protein
MIKEAISAAIDRASLEVEEGIYQADDLRSLI